MYAKQQSRRKSVTHFLRDTMHKNNNYKQALAPLMLLDIFNKRTSKNGG